MRKTTRVEAVKLVDEVSLAIAEGRELPVVKLTKIFNYVLDSKPTLMTVKEVSSEYRVGITKIYEWFKNGLKKTKCAGTKIRVSDLEKFIEDGKA